MLEDPPSCVWRETVRARLLASCTVAVAGDAGLGAILGRTLGFGEHLGRPTGDSAALELDAVQPRDRPDPRRHPQGAGQRPAFPARSAAVTA